MRKLTIGMATHDDFDGVYFTIQSIRLFHPEILDDVEWVIIDNNPKSGHSKCIRNLMNWIKEPVQYLPYTNKQSTTVRNKIFDLAETPYVISVDCHVMFAAGSLKKLIDYYDLGLDAGNLLQGPLLYDDGETISTHFDHTWSGNMWGTWQTDDRGKDPNAQPFEIPSQGCGIFSSRKDSWLRFNDNFDGFGGEEGYIHEKYRQHGKKAICLPYLRWMHRFFRPEKVSYPNDLKQRFANYVIGFEELGLDKTELIDHFSKSIGRASVDRILKNTLT